MQQALSCQERRGEDYLAILPGFELGFSDGNGAFIGGLDFTHYFNDTFGLQFGLSGPYSTELTLARNYPSYSYYVTTKGDLMIVTVGPDLRFGKECL